MYDEYEDGEGGGASLGRKLALGIGVIAIAAAGFFAFRAVTGGGDGDDDAVGPAGGSAPADRTDVTGTDGSEGSDGSDDPLATSLDDEPDPGPTSAPDEPEDSSVSSANTDPETSSGASTPSSAPVTTEPAARPPATTAPATYPTRQDGTPEWVTVIYDRDSVTLKGVVPDDAAKTQLQTLAEQYARTPEQRATVNNLVTLNPAMPRGVGIRVVELTSTRFPPGSDEIGIEHAAEINRVVAAMQALPNTSALIVGHADQQGDEVVNYVLSRDRANAVLLYMVSQGIAIERLTATAVGEEELLSLDDDQAALELNRRTEFVLFDLLG